MAFAILRVEKMNNMGSIGGKDSHELRKRETLNADPERESLNRQIIGTVALDDVKERLGKTGVSIRKDSVLAIDVFATASPEFFARNHPDDPACQAFQINLVKFLHKEFGEDNVVSLRAHHDETSPHWHATVVPIREKMIKVGRQVKTERLETRLCAKDWLGGDRHTLSKLQTRFANSMQDLGLQRGIMGSQAKHVEVKQFYTLAQEATTRVESIQQHFPRIRPDQYAERVEKPGFFEGAEAFAKKSVTNAMNQLSADIEKVNRSIDQAKQNELQKTAAPAINALIQKSNARLNQAENALLSLGYRLDQHGNPINILEERKEVIKGVISNILPKSRSMEFFQEELANRGIKIIASKDDQETIGRNRYQVAVFKDGKGEPISSRDLGPDFMTSSILKKIEENMQAEEQKESILKSKKAYDINLAKIFKEHNGNISDVSRRLKNLKIDDIVDMVNSFGKPYGDVGITYIRGRIVEDMAKSELQLKRDKEQLNKEGHDLGIKRDRGYRIG